MVPNSPQSIVSILQPIVASRDLHSVLANAAEQLGQALGVSRAVVMPSSQDALSHHGPVEWTKDEVDPRLDSSFLSLLQHIENLVITRQEMFIVADCIRHPFFEQHRLAIQALKVKSLLALCTRCGETPNGVIIFLQCDQGRSWTDQQRICIETVAHFVGLAIDHATSWNVLRRKQSGKVRTLSLLYRLSHKLSMELSLEDIFHQAFLTMRDELGLRRIWLGLLNETGTRIIGQAAYGPGWKKKLIEVNVEIGDRDHALAQVMTAGQSLFLSDPSAVIQGLGVRQVFSRFELHQVAVVPMIARDQIVGVLIAQPNARQVFEEKELALLSDLANEVAAIIRTRRLEQQLLEGEKMRTASLLAAGIAHNFNNLLQAILGQASLLEIQAQDEVKVLRAAKIITEATTCGAALVKQLINFAELEEPHREACDINLLLEITAKSWSHLLLPRQHIQLRLDANLPRAFVDSKQLTRVLLSLVSNASEAMSGGGVIVVSTGYLEDNNEEGDDGDPGKSYVTITVKDSGSGMDEETRRRCFEPFFTTKDVDPGSGLGMSRAGLSLAAAYSLMKRNQGRLRVESKPREGATFVVYVPVLGSVQETANHSLEKNNALDEADSPRNERLLSNNPR